MRITFDSNILVYAVDRQDPRHALATDLIARATRGDCRQTLQSLAESFNVLTRKFRMPIAEAYGWVQSFQSLFPVASADESDLAAAIDAVEHHHLSFWEGMLWATAPAPAAVCCSARTSRTAATSAASCSSTPSPPPTASWSTGRCRRSELEKGQSA